MLDLRTPSEKRKGWWIEERATVPCILPKDGLLAIFLRKDVEDILNAHYIYSPMYLGREVWFFNSTKDREIAEVDGDRVCCNPQVLIQHFMKEGNHE